MDGVWFAVETRSFDEPHTQCILCCFDEPHTQCILSDPYWREKTLCDFVGKTLSVGLHLDIYRPTSFKHDMMVETTKLSILIMVWMT